MVLTEKDVNYLEKRFKRTFATKSDLKKLKSDILNLLSDVMGELKKIRENTDILAPKVSDHEERIEKLEKHTGISQTSA